ncbi:hypothetical protein K439DRAFT_1279506, partial [Ramaria rubella]
NSFLFPFSREMLQLGHGVPTWHALEREIFWLCVFAITKSRDMQAIKSNKYIKGPNTFFPCHMCQIQGCCDPEHDGTNYYYPLHAPAGAIRLILSPAQDWDPWKLPLHTDQGCKKSIAYIQNEYRAKTQGINKESILVHLPGFSHVNSVPHKWMHLFLENFAPMLVDLWTGTFKGLDTGTKDYEIPSPLWDLIYKETVNSTATILAVFCHALPNIAKERHIFTAEAWGFWIIYLAPQLL